MDQDKGPSDFFLGLLGVAVIGLLVALMLFGLLPLRGGTELVQSDINRPTEQTPNPQPRN
jgi:hypothetical protein